jgi:hypothetical protein
MIFSPTHLHIRWSEFGGMQYTSVCNPNLSRFGEIRNKVSGFITFWRFIRCFNRLGLLRFSCKRQGLQLATVRYEFILSYFANGYSRSTYPNIDSSPSTSIFLNDGAVMTPTTAGTIFQLVNPTGSIIHE